MRKINHIVIHCSATKEGHDFSAADIRRWHKQRGWSDIGYHYVIKLDGTVEQGRPLERMGAHVKGHNKYSIGICLIGGLDDNMKPKPTYTQAQWDSLLRLVKKLKADYPGAQVLGHRDFKGVHKACPCFDAKTWWATGIVRNHGKPVATALKQSKRVKCAVVGTVGTVGLLASSLNEAATVKEATERAFSGFEYVGVISAVVVFLAMAWIIYTKVLDNRNAE